MAAQLHSADFRPPTWLANRHLQTLLPRMLPRRRLYWEDDPPFLFPGNYKEYARLHEASGLHEYDLGLPA